MKERLQKIIAAAGIASRRKAEDMIREGRVMVNGQVVRKLGSQAYSSQDSVKVDGKRIRPEPLEYFAVHKPRGVLSSASDPTDRKVVTDMIPSGRRLYPAGRLDYNSEGLMILTNDGDVTRKITRGGVPKVYRVKVHGSPDEGRLKKLRKGIFLEGVKLAPSRIRVLKRADNSWFEVTLWQGKKRQIREMFQSCGHPVMRLRRIAIGPIPLGALKPGSYRRLASREVESLKEL